LHELVTAQQMDEYLVWIDPVILWYFHLPLLGRAGAATPSWLYRLQWLL